MAGLRSWTMRVQPRGTGVRAGRRRFLEGGAAVEGFALGAWRVAETLLPGRTIGILATVARSGAGGRRLLPRGSAEEGTPVIARRVGEAEEIVGALRGQAARARVCAHRRGVVEGRSAKVGIRRRHGNWGQRRRGHRVISVFVAQCVCEATLAIGTNVASARLARNATLGSRVFEIDPAEK